MGWRLHIFVAILHVFIQACKLLVCLAISCFVCTLFTCNYMTPNMSLSLYISLQPLHVHVFTCFDMTLKHELESLYFVAIIAGVYTLLQTCVWVCIFCCNYYMYTITRFIMNAFI